MLVVGAGRLAKLVAVKSKPTSVSVMYRGGEKAWMKETKKEISRVDELELPRYPYIFLALPPAGIKDFIYWHGPYLAEGTVIYIPATSLYTDQVEVPAHVRKAAAKFAGHAERAAAGEGENVFVVNSSRSSDRKYLQEWLGDAFTVIEGSEQEVETANKAAVEETLRMIVNLEKRLQEQNVSKTVQQAVLRQIPAGVIEAHMNGSHGEFAAGILEQMERGDRHENG
ncbi:hypothetical protein SAMN05421781_2923 [Marinococcus luteus]|uniref:Pyrroline-5-carboxylate reductase catalytic N-terminal domain-containing protein n=1 Tax=Marinococcus luteus TaxID=1122204 RepID=A0A1H2XVS2_9BACI|nr:hypothetical protein [Marinococcus luteus]SDW96469.1 hypothetical protein SAMN05421781_2923 [Marinococcus luteus]